MQGTVKARLLLTSALFLFVQIPTMQAQVTVDVIKITCQQIVIGDSRGPRGTWCCGLAGTTTANATARSSNPKQSQRMRRRLPNIATNTATRRHGCCQDRPRLGQMRGMPSPLRFASRQAYSLTYRSCQSAFRLERARRSTERLARQGAQNEAGLRTLLKRAN